MEKPLLKLPSKTKGDIKESFYHKPKVATKENRRSHDFKLHTEQRAIKRAIFDYSVATKLLVIEEQKKQEAELQKMIEEEEIRLLRKEMIPKAQLMPFFDKPFSPQRSKRPLTIPREPSFHITSSKCWNCFSNVEINCFQQKQNLKPY